MAEELVSVAEIAEMLDVARNSAWRWTQRPDFPEPIARLAVGPIWQKRDIEAWASESLPRRGRPRSAPS